MPARPRTLVAMIDGLDSRYLDRGDMPQLSGFGKQGTSHPVSAVLPTVTNANNVSIACAGFPDEHGITGNSYLDEATGTAEYMEDGSAILVPTVFARLAEQGRASALLTAKVKTINLLAAGATLAVAAERPEQDLVDRYGPAPEIYSAEINHWLWKVAIDLLETRPELELLEDGYRSHGSLHEQDVPLITYNTTLPEPAHRSSNAELLLPLRTALSLS